ncbi:S1C family serine protease [Gimesia aquarii]|uniref:Serine protease HhoA n=1 Tax=Gimesia aquarii TaxID=2527964 RepID=A0A517WYZ5_9PLAN|nr:trypsin-like peptidase domain-containing protein [Gimesia aquarii]QDU10461.1 Putative serine protease HhoA precursor [Gimesia aquarii]
MKLCHSLNKNDAATALLRHILSNVLGCALVLMVSQVTAEEVKVRKPVSPVVKTKLSEVFFKTVPDSLEDLQEIEKQVTSLTKASIHSTVSVRVGDAQGSGVIIDNKSGYILTAAHVIGLAQKNATIILHDGRTLKGKTMGLNRGMDAGLIKLVDEDKTKISKLPVVKMGDNSKVEPGDWVIATGHPNGYQAGRPPVVRLGRIVSQKKHLIQTDCTLIGGDSGGPLFNMSGDVIGIHSRIGPSTSWNFHIPASAFQNDWEKLVSGDMWGAKPLGQNAVLGVNGVNTDQGCKVVGVTRGFPAQIAGIKENDVIIQLNNQRITGIEQLAEVVQRYKPGQTIQIKLIRDKKTMTFEVQLAARD